MADPLVFLARSSMSDARCLFSWRRCPELWSVRKDSRARTHQSCTHSRSYHYGHGTPSRYRGSRPVADLTYQPCAHRFCACRDGAWRAGFCGSRCVMLLRVRVGPELSRLALIGAVRWPPRPPEAVAASRDALIIVAMSSRGGWLVCDELIELDPLCGFWPARAPLRIPRGGLYRDRAG